MAFNQKKYGDYEGDYVQSSVTQSYVECGGDISYFFQGENVSGYLINHRFYEATLYDKTVDIETYLYIENGLLTVGENTYYAHFSKEGEMPELKLVKKKSWITSELKKQMKKKYVLAYLLHGYSTYKDIIEKYALKNWLHASQR